MGRYAHLLRIPAVPRTRSEVTVAGAPDAEAAKEARIAASLSPYWASLFGRQSHAGRAVTGESALELSAVWACVRQTAQTIASLPLAVYERQADDSRLPVTDRLAEILTVSPNARQTALEHWEGQIAWLLTNGNFYAERVQTGAQLSALEPLAAVLVEPVQREDGALTYAFHDRGKREVLPADKVFHVRGFGFGGLKGLSAIRYGVQSLGAGLAADEAAARVFANGLSASGFLETGQALDDEQREQLQALLERYTGSTNAAKVMVLEGGLKFASAMLNPEDAQLLETRRFAIEDICRWFGVPPIIIGHSAEGQTMWGTGVEQILLGWMNQGLNPIMRRVEAGIRKSLIGPARRRVYAEWNREGILQMDAKAKSEFLRLMVNAGIMTPNEARSKLNLPRVEGGDTLLVQGAMMPLETLLALPPGAPRPAPAKED